MKILITGVAGFIGSSLTDVILNLGSYQVIGLDNFDDFYDRKIKINNLKNAIHNKNFSFYDFDLRCNVSLYELFQKTKPDIVIHLAAKAGVRPSILDPLGYYDVNVNGTLNILETMRMFGTKRMIFASSSSVYGNCKLIPFSEEMSVDNPISPYAASKKAGELLCHTYHHLYSMDIFCLRFFTVYGPRQRPDLAIHKFTSALLNGEEIPLYGDGSTRRDYTHISDITQGILKAMENLHGYEIFNLGESYTTSLNELVATLEHATGKKAIKNIFPVQEGDVFQTYANITKARQFLGYTPTVKFEEGVFEYVKWFRKNYNV